MSKISIGRLSRASVFGSCVPTCVTLRGATFPHLACKKNHTLIQVDSFVLQTEAGACSHWSFSFTRSTTFDVRVSRLCLRAAESILRNTRRQRQRDQASISSTDVMLLVAFTRRRGQAEFGVTLKCHLD